MTREQYDYGSERDWFLYKSGFELPKLEEFEGNRAFLFLETDRVGQWDPVDADTMAKLLNRHKVPVVILNACQSAMQIGDKETSLGSRFMNAGIQFVVAMAYSVTVSAAERMMTHLYKTLLDGTELAPAIRDSRAELYRHKERHGFFDQMVTLEDWVLPVVYQNRELTLTPRSFTPEEKGAHQERQTARFPAPQLTFGFQGRDLDVLLIEKALLSRCNILLVRGMAGAGKSTLLRHLGYWWQTTAFVDRVFYFGYDEKAWTRQQILHALAEKLLSPAERAAFSGWKEAAQQARIAELLRSRAHLLMLDNLESIIGPPLSIPNTLDADEQEQLRDFLAALHEGKTFVLLGSRSSEEWLAKGTFADNVYELSGLDPEAASRLARRILESVGATRYVGDEDLDRLLRLLAGYPLALEVVLANLSKQTPKEVLEALESGDVDLDSPDAQTKTESIVRCIEYSHGNLSEETQALLSCLAPFTSVVSAQALPHYTEQLKQQPELADLPFETWEEVLQEAARWGLLSPHEIPGFLRLQPIFPYFLRNRLKEDAERRQAIERAFRAHMDGAAGAYYQLLESKEPDQRRVGETLVGLEYENLSSALHLALRDAVSIRRPYVSLSTFLDRLGGP